MSITYDIKKKFNAQSTLKGNKVDVFHETNPSLVKTRNMKIIKEQLIFQHLKI